MKKFNLILALLFLFSTAFGADTVINTNKVVLGQKSSAADKLLEFQINAGAANPKIKVNPATAKLQFTNDGTNYKDIGSGGSGSKNFTTLGDAEAGLGTIAGYADAAGTSPVDGTGGSPVSTITISGTTPLENLNSFIFTKDAANRQGNGFSVPFTIDLQQRAKVLNISFKYLVNSGTFVAGSAGVDSDVTVWIYDVTNAQLIQPSSYKLLSNNTSIADVFNATFQTASNASSYRLIFHIGSTSALAYSLKIDDIQVSPSNYAYGTPITDWQSYTPAITGAGTPTSVDFRWRRNGDSIDVQGSFVTGTTSASNATFTLPFVADSLKIAAYNSFGDALRINSTGTTRKRFKLLASASSNIMILTSDDYTNASGPATPLAGNSIWGNSETQKVSAFGIPIAGWSSSVQMSDQADTRVVSVNGNTQTATGTAAGGIMIMSKNDDTHNSWNNSTGVYTVPVSGWYRARAGSNVQGTISAGNYVGLAIRKNNSAIKYNYTVTERTATYSVMVQVDHTFWCNAGETIDFYSFTNITTPSHSALLGGADFAITRESGPNQIAASESISASYWVSAATFSTSTTIPINFDSREFDSHNAVTTGASTWRFTAPISGTYKISGSIFTPAAGLSLRLYKNGTYYKSLSVHPTATNSQNPSTLVRLNAGEYIDIRGGTGGSTVTGGVLANDSTSHVSIERIGN